MTICSGEQINKMSYFVPSLTAPIFSVVIPAVIRFYADWWEWQNYTGDGGTAEDATINMPNAIALSRREGGTMALADFGNNAVRVITPSCLEFDVAGDSNM